MTPPSPDPPRANRLSAWRTSALAAWSTASAAVAGAGGRLAGVVRSHTTPARALAAGAGVVVLGLTTVAAVALSSSPGEADSRWVATVGPEAPEVEPPPPHQPLRSLAVPPEPSPPPGEPDGSDAPDGPSGPLPPEVTGEFAAWAIMDLNTGQITGSDDYAQLSTTASMIKTWLVADYLHRHGQLPDDPARLDELSLIVRESNNELTQTLFAELGSHQSIHRLISTCGLTDSEAAPWYWSNTRLSPRDTARMGACLTDGRAAGGPERTEWLVNEMRNVAEWGAFGIPEAVPPDERGSVAVKNGWVVRSEVDEYHVSCLAIGDGWSMGVLTRFPAHLGYLHGAEICRSLAAEHLP